MKEDILKAYRFLRKNEQSIPDHVLDFMLNTSLEAIEKPKMTDLKKELLRFKDIVDGMVELGEKKLQKLDLKESKNDLKSISTELTEYEELIGLILASKFGAQSIIELAEELEKDND